MLSVYAGLRPLVRPASSDDGNETAQISRDHTVLVSATGLITVTGGKWTTYRKMAEDVVEQAIRVAGLRPSPCVTENLAIHGATTEESGKSPSHLAVYGTDVRKIEALIAENPALAFRLHPDLPYQAAEVIWHAREEMARTVEDVLARRTRGLLLNAAAAEAAAAPTANLMQSLLGQDADWKKQQLAAFGELVSLYRVVARQPQSELR